MPLSALLWLPGCSVKSCSCLFTAHSKEGHAIDRAAEQGSLPGPLV